MRKEQKQAFTREKILVLNGSTSRSFDSFSWTDYREGNELPNFKQAILNKENATTALSAEQWSVKAEACLLEFSEYGTSLYSDNSGGFALSAIAGRLPSTTDAYVVSVSEARCLQRYFGKLRELRSPLQGQVLLGEIGQTVNLLRNPFKTGVKLLEGFLIKRKKQVASCRNRLRNAKLSKRERETLLDWLRRNAGNVGDEWLEIRFGLLPLISDAGNLVDLLTSKCEYDDVKSYRCYGKAETAVSSQQSWSAVYGVQQLTTMTLKTVAESIIRFGYRTRVSSFDEERLRMARESFLNLRDLPSTAWELLPFSFLVDYFVNVGSIIESVFESQENVVWTSKSTVSTDCSEAYGFKALPLAQRYVVRRFVPANCQIKRRRVIRSTQPAGIPPVTFALPRSDIKLANIAALLAGLLNSLK